MSPKTANQSEWLEAWIAAAVTDGWTLAPSYAPSEPVEHAGCMTREAAPDECVDAPHRTTWIVQYLNRPAATGAQWGRSKPEIEIHVWGPDRLAVRAPRVYSMESLRAALRTCLDCNKTDVDVQQIGFAGRTCAECHAKNVATVEHPGWTS